VWEPQKDLKTGKFYWTNHALQKTTWEPPKGSTTVKQTDVVLVVAPTVASTPGASSGAWGQQTAGAWGQQAEWGQQPATSVTTVAAAGTCGTFAGYGYTQYAAHTGGYACDGYAANTRYNQQYASAGHTAQQAPGSTAHV
jgi:hypothetical protein